MIRTLIKPDNSNISIKLPEEFVGKQVEVIAFTIEEVIKPASTTILTHHASEATLAKDWLNSEEDSAWQNL